MFPEVLPITCFNRHQSPFHSHGKFKISHFDDMVWWCINWTQCHNGSAWYSSGMIPPLLHQGQTPDRPPNPVVIKPFRRFRGNLVAISLVLRDFKVLRLQSAAIPIRDFGHLTGKNHPRTNTNLRGNFLRTFFGPYRFSLKARDQGIGRYEFPWKSYQPNLSRAAKRGVSNGGVSRSGLVLPFLSFLGLPDFSGFSRFARGRSGDFPDSSLFLFLGLIKRRGTVPKGPRHNLDLSRKKWETPGFGTPPGLAALKSLWEFWSTPASVLSLCLFVCVCPSVSLSLSLSLSVSLSLYLFISLSLSLFLCTSFLHPSTLSFPQCFPTLSPESSPVAPCQFPCFPSFPPPPSSLTSLPPPFAPSSTPVPPLLRLFYLLFSRVDPFVRSVVPPSLSHPVSVCLAGSVSGSFLLTSFTLLRSPFPNVSTRVFALVAPRQFPCYPPFPPLIPGLFRSPFPDISPHFCPLCIRFSVLVPRFSLRIFSGKKCEITFQGYFYLKIYK